MLLSVHLLFHCVCTISITCDNVKQGKSCTNIWGVIMLDCSILSLPLVSVSHALPFLQRAAFLFIVRQSFIVFFGMMLGVTNLLRPLCKNSLHYLIFTLTTINKLDSHSFNIFSLRLYSLTSHHSSWLSGHWSLSHCSLEAHPTELDNSQILHMGISSLPFLVLCKLWLLTHSLLLCLKWCPHLFSMRG